jgi:hypothetical protein
MANIGGGKGEQTKRVFLPLTIEEIAEVDTWGFARRIRDRSEVLRTLVRAGLDSACEVTAEQKV